MFKLKAALLGACAAISLASTAHADSGLSLWQFQQGTNADVGVWCGIATGFSNGQMVEMHVSTSDTRLHVETDGLPGNYPNVIQTGMILQVDGNAPWQKPLNATASGHTVTLAIAPAATKEFVRQIATGVTLRLTVDGIPPITVGLTGITDAWTPFTACVNGVIPTMSDLLAIEPWQYHWKGASPWQPVEVALNNAHGVKEVSGTVNGNTPVSFVLDSGASYVQLPAKIAAKLRQDGSLTVADYRGAIKSVLADGRTLPDTVYRLRSLTVGDRTVGDVLCTISADGVAPLLGQSFLNRLSSWSIDNARGVLVLGEPV